MIQVASLRDRLPSALIALGLQAGLFALLALSFEIVRQLPAEKETILTLAPLTRPVPARPVMVIDGRPKAQLRSSIMTAPTPVPADVPTIAASPVIAAPAAAGTATQAAPAPGKAKADETEALLHPDRRVKDEDYWAAQRAAAQTPPRVPCVSLGTTVIGMGGAQKEEHSVRVDLNCAIPALQSLGDSAGRYNSPPPPFDPDAGHVSDAAFQRARAAAQARQALFSKAPLPLERSPAPR